MHKSALSLYACDKPLREATVKGIDVQRLCQSA